MNEMITNWTLTCDLNCWKSGHIISRLVDTVIVSSPSNPLNYICFWKLKKNIDKNSNKNSLTKVSNHESDKTFHEKIPNELKTSVEDPIKTVIKRNLDTVNENANIVRKRLNNFIHPDHPFDQIENSKEMFKVAIRNDESRRSLKSLS